MGPLKPPVRWFKDYWDEQDVWFFPVRAYDAKYGGLADQPTTEWDADFVAIEIDRAEFEDVWTRARAHLEAKRS
jgi:hypothetical protein